MTIEVASSSFSAQRKQATSASISTDNPYSSGSAGKIGEGAGLTLPARHPLNILKRCTYIGISLYGLNFFNVQHVVFQSPKVSHEWFKVGLAATIAGLFLKAYVEMYEGKIRKQKVDYANFKNCTHATIALILISSIAFHVALWPVYGVNTFLILFLASFGVLIQISLFVPTIAQNIAGIILMTVFLQQYK